jgi:signal transduction histidine kinase
MTDFLFLAMILAGVTILGVMAWLLRGFRRLARLNLELTRLNEASQFDLPDFLRSSWPPLRCAGVTGMTWTLDWFGYNLVQTHGDCSGNVTRHFLHVGENTLDMALYHPRLRGESRYMLDFFLNHFLLLLNLDLWIKVGSVQGAFEQAARIRLFMQHDIKNISQFVELAADHLENIRLGDESGLQDRLRRVLPEVRSRSRRIMRVLAGRVPSYGVRIHALAPAWRQAAEMHGLAAEVIGAAAAILPKGTLESILDNLLVNYTHFSRQTGRTPKLKVILARDDTWALSTLTDTAGACPAISPERLFEPFRTDRPGGLGIGLYQSRQQALHVGGKLEAVAPEGGPLVFELRLPWAEM